MNRILIAAMAVGGSVVAGMATGCTEVESEDVATSGLYAAFTARVESDGTHVGANLNVGGSSATATNVELTGDDKIKATLGEDTKELEKVHEVIDINDPHYAAFFPGAVSAGAELLVAFERTVDDGAPASKVALPTEANGAVPEGTRSRADAEIVITFEAGADDETTDVSISGDCFQSASQSVDGDNATSVTFAPGALKEPEPEEGEEPAAPASCEAKVSISRTRHGKLDPAFEEGGIIDAVRAEQKTFQSTP